MLHHRLWRREAAAVAVAVAAVATATSEAAVAVSASGAAAVDLRRPSPPSVADEAQKESEAAEAKAGPVVTIPFPSPLPGVSRGRLHNLPALQCRLHPTTPGGVSPDPDAVTDPYGRGGTGWVLRANASASDVVIPYGAGTCATPLDDAAQLEFLAAPDEMNDEWFSTVGSNVASGGDTGAEFEWAAYGEQARLNFAALRNDKGSSGVASAEFFRPHPCGSAGEHIGLVCADEVARMLTVHRNQDVGTVQRHRGLFDVLSVSRVTNGVVLDRHGLVVAAQDRVSDAAGYDGVAVVMYTTRDNHTRPVLIGEAALLSLGRALMVDPSWLGASFPGGINVTVLHHMIRYNRLLYTDVWPVRHNSRITNASSRWLARIESILCLPSSTSFVVDDGLCHGVEEPQPSGRGVLRAGGHSVADRLGVGRLEYPEAPEIGSLWRIEPAQQAVSAPACSSFDAVYENAQLQQPIWLLGRGSRELHQTGPRAETEVGLARRLTSCAYNGTRRDLISSQSYVRDTSALIVDLSQRYRRDLFRVDPPADPVSDGAIILAVLVVVPEAVAVILLILQRRSRPHRRVHWRCRKMLTLALVLLAGAIALAGVGYLDREEQAGHEWRAASVRTCTRIQVNTTEQKYVPWRSTDYRGRLSLHSESLIIVARTGYRPHVTRRLLVGSIIAYVLLAVAGLAHVVVAGWLRRHPPTGEGENDIVGSSPADFYTKQPGRQMRATAPLAVDMGDLPAEDDGGGGGDVGDDATAPRGWRVPTQDGGDR
ncbi:hypothetical protein MMPV_005206 [Pyropia vietnamensis]